MEERDREIGARVADARSERNLPQAELAEVLGVDPSIISKMESGKRRIDGYELALLAEALGTTSRALLGLRTRGSALLAAARLGVGDNEAGLNRARTLLELDGVADELGLDGKAQPRRFTTRPRAGRADAVAAAREVLGVEGSYGLADLVQMVEREFGIDVAVEPLGDGPPGLLVQHADEVALVVLNGDNHIAKRRFTLAHELGHWLLGDPQPLIVEGDLGGDSETEKRADRFALELLMPEDAVRRVIGSAGDLTTGLVDGLVRFGVSREAFVNRLSNLGLISTTDAAALRNDSVKSWFYRAGRHSDYLLWAPELPTRRVPSRIEKRLIEAYLAGRIGIGMIAQAFNERPADLADRLRDLGPVADVPVSDVALAAI
jgi:transcriptional regulator with XRE-family HTH domain